MFSGTGRLGSEQNLQKETTQILDLTPLGVNRTRHNELLHHDELA